MSIPPHTSPVFYEPPPTIKTEYFDSHCDEDDIEEIIRPKKRLRTGEAKLPVPEKIAKGNLEDFKRGLVSLNSIDFEAYMLKLNKIKIYTNEEKEVIKDIRRKIKNRESARKSRLNKKNKVDDLEVKIKKLAQVTFKMKEAVSILKKENNQIKNEINFLVGMINSNPILSKIYQDLLSNPFQENIVMKNNQYLLSLLFSSGLVSNVEMDPNSLNQLNHISNHSYGQCNQQFLYETHLLNSYIVDCDSIPVF